MSSDFPFHRKSIRLMGWDYRTPGSYFITICTGGGIYNFNKKKLMAIVEKYWSTIPQRHPHVKLDKFIIMPNHIHGIINIIRFPDMYFKKSFPGINHSGFIGFAGAFCDDAVGDPSCVGVLCKNPGARSLHNAPTNQQHQHPKPHQKISNYRLPGSIGSIVQGFKTGTKRAIRYHSGYEQFTWQRDYWDRVIRNKTEYQKIQYYIEKNSDIFKRKQELITN